MSRRLEESAFTMMEMVIAMVLVAGLLVVMSTVLMKSFGESQRSREERGAMKAARETFAQFQSDVRVAQSPERDPRYVGNANDLSGALLMGEQVSLQLPGQPTPTTLDVRDILFADSSSVLFRADVMPQTGVECVRYYVEPTTRAFMREVRSYDPATDACTTSLGNPKIMMEMVR